LRGYLLGIPLIVLLGSFTTRILGVSLQLTVLYLISNGTYQTRSFE